MQIRLISMLIILVFASCSYRSDTKSDTQANNNRLDSLKNYYTFDITSPQYFILTIKRSNIDKGMEVCANTQELGDILTVNKMTNRLFFDTNDNPSIIDSSGVLNSSYHLDQYNINLVDSLSTYLIPSVIDSIKRQSKFKQFTTLWKYSELYDQYFIHALLRQRLHVYRDCETGYPIAYLK